MYARCIAKTQNQRKKEIEKSRKKNWIHSLVHHRHCRSSIKRTHLSITNKIKFQLEFFQTYQVLFQKMSAMRTTSLLRISRVNMTRSASMSVQRNLSNMVIKPSMIGRQLSRSNGMMKQTLPSFQVRTYAASSGLSNQEIQNRIFEVLKSFEKVDPSKVRIVRSFERVEITKLTDCILFLLANFFRSLLLPLSPLIWVWTVWTLLKL